jgi:hypothetical protein
LKEIPKSIFHYDSFDHHYEKFIDVNISKDGWVNLDGVIDEIGDVSEPGMTLLPR